MIHHVSITADISYGPDSLQSLDLYRPDVQGPVPVVAYVHGGGWQLGDKSADSKERLEALASYGVAVASLNYRLVPQAVYPAQIQDVSAGIDWLRRHGKDHGLATRRIGVWGASAGGHLAAMVALTANDDNRVGAVVDWYGASDLVANSRRSWLEKEFLSVPFERPFLPADDEESFIRLAAQASPLNHVHAGAPPFLIAHGDLDRITPVEQSTALHEALVRAGVPSTFVLIGGAGHEAPAFQGAAHLAMTAAFLLEHLRGPDHDDSPTTNPATY